MFGRKAILAVMFGVGCEFAAGCGPVTPAGLMMKGAMWAGKEVVKKEVKKHKAAKSEARGGDDQGHGSGARARG